MRVVALVVASLVAVVMANVAAIGLWGSTVLLDTNGSERYVSEIVGSPNVVKGLGEHLGDQLVDLYDENISFASRVPEALKDEAAALDLTITEEIRERSMSVVASDAVRGAFAEALVALHGEIVEILTTDRADSQTSDGANVRLNLVPSATALFRSLQESGAWPDSPPIPEVDRSASPPEQAARLEAALGFDLPDGLTTVSVLEEGESGPDVADARAWVSAAEILTWVSLVVGVLALAGAGLAVRTFRARLWVVSGIIVLSALSTWVVARQTPGRLASTVDDVTWSPAVDDIASSLIAPLATSSLVIAVSAVVAPGITEIVRRRRTSGSGTPGQVL